jgi:hypothetical protein
VLVRETRHQLVNLRPRRSVVRFVSCVAARQRQDVMPALQRPSSKSVLAT